MAVPSLHGAVCAVPCRPGARMGPNAKARLPPMRSAGLSGEKSELTIQPWCSSSHSRARFSLVASAASPASVKMLCPISAKRV